MKWDAARATAASAVPLPAVDLPLPAAVGATLAAPLVSLAPSPAQDISAMDGYAVRGPGPWRLAGVTRAGDAVPTPLRDGEACEVATGAAVPPGCEGVLPHERAVRAGREVLGAAPAGRHVRRAGEEFAARTALLGAGTPVTAYVAGLASVAGLDVLRVRRRPLVRLLTTGDELIDVGLPGDGRVRDALGPLLVPLLAGLGAEGLAGAVRPERVADTTAAVTDVLRSRGEDVLVTTGASAHGPADLLRAALASAGAQVLVPEVDCRPGHPALLALLPDGRRVVGLPGNPFAAVAGVVTLLEPLLAALAGRRPAAPAPARAAQPLPGHPSATRLLPVRVRAGVALSLPGDGAAMLLGVASADGLAVIDPGDGVPAGGAVPVLHLP